jgi:cytidylate kinase
MNKMIITVDGPAGSGKQRIAKYIASKYKFFHLDSGVLYRRLTSKIIKNKININNSVSIKKFIQSLSTLSSRNHYTLRKENISKASAKIAKISAVRIFINNQQKIIVKKMLQLFQGCVIDGRDIGSKVFIEAQIKLFIDVKVQIRAKRRHKQLIEIGEKSIHAQILKEIQLRDKLDINRKHSPLIKPKGSITIDNSEDFKTTIIAVNIALKKIK